MQWLERARDTGIVAACVWGSAFALLAGSLLNTVTRLRMVELRDNLQAANEKNDDLRNVALLSRVALIKQRVLAGGREDAAQYRQEAESALITIKQTRGRSRQLGITDRLALPFLNGMNRLLGLPRLKLGKTPEQELVLDLAFQFESFREYGKAVRSYTVYLTDYAHSEEEKNFALLHRGFCHAMLNHFESAVADFTAVENSASRRHAETARRLNSFMKELRERIRIIESVNDPARRGELYYEAAAYAKAIENFDQLEESRRSERVRFLTARSLEETGQTAKALDIYRGLVRSAPHSFYALNANRRMYMLGTFLGNDEKLAQESKKNSETVIKDKEFIAAVTHLEKSASLLHAEAAAAEATEKREIAAAQRIVLTEESVTPAKSEPSPVSKETPPPIEPPKPTVMDLSSERAAERAENLPVEKKEQLIRTQKDKIDKLTMIDGNIFYGVTFREDQESLWLFTVLGNLELKKTDIRQREKVDGSTVFK